MSALGQPARFVLVGAAGFGLNVAVFTALFGLGARYLLASVLSYLVSNGAMYLGNRYFTFASSSRAGFLVAYVRFLAIGVVIAALTALLLALLVEGLALDPRLGQALALTALVPLSFLLSRRFAFRATPRDGLIGEGQAAEIWTRVVPTAVGAGIGSPARRRPSR